MVGHRIANAIDKFIQVVFELDIQPVGQGCDARVVAVVGHEAVRQAFGAIAVVEV